MWFTSTQYTVAAVIIIVNKFLLQEFLLAISNFKVMPGFIGPLAYSEEIPENLKESKHEKAVKEKLRLLWVNQYGEEFCFLSNMFVMI